MAAPLRIGRRDHTVHVLDAGGRPVWNVTYSRMRPMAAAAEPVDDAAGSLLEAAAGAAAPQAGARRAASRLGCVQGPAGGPVMPRKMPAITPLTNLSKDGARLGSAGCGFGYGP